MEVQGLILQVMFKADLGSEGPLPHETIQNKNALTKKKQIDFLKDSSHFACAHRILLV